MRENNRIVIANSCHGFLVHVIVPCNEGNILTGSKISNADCLDIECWAILLTIECSVILSDVGNVRKGEVRESCDAKVHSTTTLSSAGGEDTIIERKGTVSRESC